MEKTPSAPSVESTKRVLSFKRTQHSEYGERWFTFYPKIEKLCFKVSLGSYFDERVQIHSTITTVLAIIGFCLQPFISLWFLPLWVVLLVIPFGGFYLNLPIYTGVSDCEYPEYGFYFYGEAQSLESFWICNYDKNHCFYMPWSWDWYRTSALKAKPGGNSEPDSWEHEYKGGESKNFFLEKWFGVLWSDKYPYTYTLKSGIVQQRVATLRVEEREWRWRGLMRFSYPNRIRKTISVEFDREVGEKSGSWKGGCIGCSYEMLPGETPEQTLRRMEKERKF